MESPERMSKPYQLRWLQSLATVTFRVAMPSLHLLSPHSLSFQVLPSRQS